MSTMSVHRFLAVALLPAAIALTFYTARSGRFWGEASPGAQLQPARARRAHALRNESDVLADAAADARHLPRDAPDECAAWLSAKALQSTFTSQFGQDATIYYNFFAGRRARGLPAGVFVDAGANAPRFLSNTYFLEKCLGWTGVCIEANPALAEVLRAERSCAVVNKCIDPTLKHAAFVVEAGASGHIATGADTSGGTVSVPCAPLSSILLEAGVTHADFMSIDIEGNELRALSGNDWDAVPIEMLLVETAYSSEELDMLLTDAGMWRVGDMAYLDDLYVRRAPLLRVPRATEARDENWHFLRNLEIAAKPKRSWKRAW